MPQLMVRAPDLAALEDLRPDHDALSRLGERDGWIGVSIYVLPDEPGGRLRVRVRHFAPLVGVPEDPVTGSAAGALGACLAAAGMCAEGGDLEMVVLQGQELGRPGEVAVRVASTDGVPHRVRVGGRVVPLFEGRVLGRGTSGDPRRRAVSSPHGVGAERSRMSDADDARKAVRHLLLSGDNTLKNRDDAVSRERARARFEEALELARESELDDAVTIIERRLALMEPPATAS